MEKEKTKAVTLSLKPSEEKYLIKVSKELFGSSNKSGMVSYWINKDKKEKKY